MKRAAYETFIVTIIVVLAVALSVGIYARRNEVSKGRILISELTNLRTSILFYLALNGSPPAGLETLLEGEYDFGDTGKRRYAEGLQQDEDGRIIDPFGNPYSYDSNTYWIHSITEGFERW